LSLKISKGGTLIKKLKKIFFSLKIIKICLQVVFNQFDAVLDEIFFLRFGKKITRVPVVKLRNDIKIQIVHPAIRIPRQVYG
jgi:hypothetical protein